MKENKRNPWPNQIAYETFRFGEFQLSRNAGLLRSGQPVAVPPKELGLLEILLTKRGKVATHFEIEESLWPNESVSYASLARCVHSLRKSLGDKKRSIVVTAPKRGYAMGVPVCPSANGRLLSVNEKSVYAEARAYSEYIQGDREANRSGPEAQQRAIELFESAHGMDSSYAVPLAAIADCRIYQAIRGFERPVDALREGLDACARALAVDSSLASAYAARGWLEGVIGRNVGTGLQHIDRALSIDPYYSRAHAYKAWVQRGAGELEESLASARRAAELDPYSLLNRHLLAWSYFCTGDMDRALDIERTERLEHPDVDVGHAYVAVMAAWSGLYDEAIAAAHEAERVSYRNPTISAVLSYAYARAGSVRRARELAAKLAAQAQPRVARSQLAVTFAALGDSDTALNYLAEAKAEGCPWFPGMRFDPRLGPLACDPRLRALYE